MKTLIHCLLMTAAAASSIRAADPVAPKPILDGFTADPTSPSGRRGTSWTGKRSA
jgi:hypothetical protein